jgi:hypothetical protein
MSVTAQDSDGPANDQRINRALALCAEALEICDELSVSPEIGARLQEVVSALADLLQLPAPALGVRQSVQD